MTISDNCLRTAKRLRFYRNAAEARLRAPACSKGNVRASNLPIQTITQLFLFAMDVVNNDSGTLRWHFKPFLMLQRPFRVFIAALPMLAH